MSETRHRRVQAGPRGLSGRLFWLTVAFVLLAELLVYVPSIADFRQSWLADHLRSGEIAALAILAETSGDSTMSAAEQMELLEAANVVGVHGMSARGPTIALGPGEGDIQVSPKTSSTLDNIIPAFVTLFGGQERLIETRGVCQTGVLGRLSVVLRESDLRADMRAYSLNILGLSLLISGIAGVLVFFALRAQLVRPMRRLVASMAHFQEAPEDPDRQIQPCGRSDEVGEAEAGLAELQTEVRRAFRERKRLAELGQAVAKINHDLRNILASAQLISDRLRGSDDPLVRRMGPKLYSSIDRAQRLCSDVLKYGKAREETARKVPTPLRAIVRDAVETARAGLPPEMTLAIDISPTLVVDADPDQLHRMVLNLVRNALQAMERAGRREGQVVVAAGHEGSTVYIDVTDTGPGIKEDTVDALFEPFNGGARGSGLGLAIVRDLALGHGGDVKLMASSEAGTRFRIILPDGQEDDLQVSSTAARDAAE